MAEKKKRLPFLYAASFFILLTGTVGLVYVFIAQPSSDIFKGLLYIFLGFIAFGAGEILNHPKAQQITTDKDDATASSTFSKRFHRKRNPCSLGNLFDIGAILLIFIGLSALFSQ